MYAMQGPLKPNRDPRADVGKPAGSAKLPEKLPAKPNYEQLVTVHVNTPNFKKVINMDVDMRSTTLRFKQDIAGLINVDTERLVAKTRNGHEVPDHQSLDTYRAQLGTPNDSQHPDALSSYDGAMEYEIYVSMRAG